MATVKVSLRHGYQLGSDILKEAELRDVKAGDVIEAQEESEKLIMVPNAKGILQPELVPSPTLVGVNVLRRQIISIGDVKGPFDLSEIKKLHPEDLNLLQEEADKMDAASVAEDTREAVSSRGRDDQSGGDN